MLSAVDSKTPISADGEEMLKEQTAAGMVGAPLADLTLSNKAPSVVSVTSQCSYSSTIVHVPHPESGTVHTCSMQTSLTSVSRLKYTLRELCLFEVVLMSANSYIEVRAFWGRCEENLSLETLTVL